MNWEFEITPSAEKQILKLGHTARADITRYLSQRIATPENPRRFGKALTGDLKGYWRYRVGDYRILCQIQEERVVVLVIAIGHRREIYQ
jgi:mRNA interferase RelE/StbE